MRKKFDAKFVKIFATFLFAALSFFSVKNSSAQSFLTVDDIAKDVERALLFDKDSRQQIDVYRKKDRSDKSDFTIDEGGSPAASSSKKTQLGIVVVDPKLDNFDLRQKERLAYNATVIDQFEVAIALYKQVLASEPDNSYAKFSLAVVYQKLGQFRQAKALYHELLQLDQPNEEEIAGNLLAILIEESPKDATYLLSRLSAQNPKSPAILAQAALAYDKNKNPDQAIFLLEKAVSLDSKNVDYKYNLAVLYDKAGNDEKALGLYLEVVKIYSQDGANSSLPIIAIRQRIDSIKSKL